MAEPLLVSLESIRTDGWFERIGEGIGSFQALCDIVGPRFFGFAMITGARITSLTVDRRTPDNTWSTSWSVRKTPRWSRATLSGSRWLIFDVDW